MATTPARRKRKPGMTKDKFIDETLELRAVYFVLGYVASSIPASVRYEAIEQARKQGYPQRGTDGEG